VEGEALPAIVTRVGRTITLQTDSLADVGLSKVVTLKVTLENYTNITDTTEFTISVDACVITSITKPVYSSKGYQIDTVQTYTVPEFIQVPNCEYTLTYTAVQIPTELQPYTVWNPLARTFTVDSNDNDLVGGSYTFTVEASYPPNDNVSSEPDLSFNLNFDTSCVDDFVTLTQAINTFSYRINMDGMVHKYAQFTHDKKNCPFDINLA